MFSTMYAAHDRVYQESGSRSKPTYAPFFDEGGTWHLEETGAEDLYGYIQSHAQSVDIHVLLKQYQLGDLQALERVQGTYGDFTNAPKTMAEALNTMIAAEQYFLSLPKDVRAQFGHNFNQFVASMDQPDFLQRAGLAPTPDAVTTPSTPPDPGATSSSRGSAADSASSAPVSAPASPSAPPAPASV